MGKRDEQWSRIAAIVGDVKETTVEEGVERYCKYLQEHLKLPCEVKGIEDFRWEEFYVLGPGDRAEYKELRKTQPSYSDRYELLRIEQGEWSEWMLFEEDITAFVRRRSDGKEFVLGLSELEAPRSDPANRQLLDDYSVWLVNSR